MKVIFDEHTFMFLRRAIIKDNFYWKQQQWWCNGTMLPG